MVGTQATGILPLLARLAAAVPGGYAFAATASVGLSRVLPGTRADALLTGLLASFALYAGAVVWAFAARTAVLAWAGLLVPTLVFAGLGWLSGPPGAP